MPPVKDPPIIRFPSAWRAMELTEFFGSKLNFRITPAGDALLAAHEREWSSFSVGVARALGGANRG